MEIARWDELQLVQRCKEGSESAFAELVRRHRPRLFSLAFRLTGDRETAEDVVQETFIAAFRTLDRFEPRPSLAAWLNTIAVRNAGRAAAKAATRPRASLDALIASDAEAGERIGDPAGAEQNDPHLAAEAAELRRELSNAIVGLPFKYRAAVVTRYVLGLEYAEAAASLEMGLNTYKSHLLRGTRMLREALATATGRAGRRLPNAAIGVAPDSPPAPISTVAVNATEGPVTARHLARAAAARSVAEPRRARFADPVPKEKAARG